MFQMTFALNSLSVVHFLMFTEPRVEFSARVNYEFQFRIVAQDLVDDTTGIFLFHFSLEWSKASLSM